MPAQAPVAVIGEQAAQPIAATCARARCGRYAAIAAAASSSDSNPSGCARMKFRMRSTPRGSQRGVTSTSTSARNNGAQRLRAARPTRPPIDAPTSTGGAGIERDDGDKVVAHLLPVVRRRRAPVAVAVAARIERDRAIATIGERGRAAGPGAAASGRSRARRRCRGDRRRRTVSSGKRDRRRGCSSRRVDVDSGAMYGDNGHTAEYGMPAAAKSIRDAYGTLSH